MLQGEDSIGLAAFFAFSGILISIYQVPAPGRQRSAAARCRTRTHAPPSDAKMNSRLRMCAAADPVPPAQLHGAGQPGGWVCSRQRGVQQQQQERLCLDMLCGRPQRYIIRIIFMVPVYAVGSFASLKWREGAIYFDTLRDWWGPWP